MCRTRFTSVFYFYEYITDSLIVGSTNHSSNGSFIRLELLEATHRALHRFFARHSDELELEIGDPIYVQKEAEDLWCEGKITGYIGYFFFVNF